MFSGAANGPLSLAACCQDVSDEVSMTPAMFVRCNLLHLSVFDSAWCCFAVAHARTPRARARALSLSLADDDDDNNQFGLAAGDQQWD